jgi:uncharacterized membrane protein
MSEINPYQAPASDVNQPITSEAGELTGPHSVSAGRGWSWLAGGFQLFTRSWLIWIVNIVIFSAIMLVIGIIPIVSIVSTLLSPMFMGGLMAGCLALDRGDELTVGHLFEGFQRNAGALAGVGGLYLLGLLLLGITAAVMVMVTGASIVGMNGELDATNQAEVAAQMGPAMLIVVLLIAALAIPLVMAVWFAPPLVMLHDMGAVEAMKLSFRGCLKNILPFLVYGIIAFVLAILAVIPVMLGFLILGPMLIASVYVAYKDIYLAPAS